MKHRTTINGEYEYGWAVIAALGVLIYLLRDRRTGRRAQLGKPQRNLPGITETPPDGSADACIVGASSMIAGDPRAIESQNLKLALATFAFHLDTFEARLRDALMMTVERPTSERVLDPVRGAGAAMLVWTGDVPATSLR